MKEFFKDNKLIIVLWIPLYIVSCIINATGHELIASFGFGICIGLCVVSIVINLVKNRKSRINLKDLELDLRIKLLVWEEVAKILPAMQPMQSQVTPTTQAEYSSGKRPIGKLNQL